MTWEPRPIPNVTPETRAYWEGTADEKLLLCECENCGLLYYYPRVLCPDCFSDDVIWREATGYGEVYSYAPTRRMTEWPESDLPHVVAYVELDEGVRMLTNIDANPEAVEIGTRVQVAFIETSDEQISIPVFIPTDRGG